MSIPKKRIKATYQRIHIFLVEALLLSMEKNLSELSSITFIPSQFYFKMIIYSLALQ